jgi:DNA-binding SARP family transcriptional activator
VSAILSPPAAATAAPGRPGAGAPPTELLVAGLGPLRIEVDGRAVPFRAGRRERGVLEYLVMHRRRAVAREELTEVFWPGSSPSHARNNLNVSVWGLRNRLREPLRGGSVAVFQDGAYRLDPALAIRVDAEELERLAVRGRARGRTGDLEGAAADLRAAAALYVGDLFEDDRYEAWIDPFRREVADTHLAALADLAECERRLGDVGAAIGLCRRGLAIEPEREDLHRLLMRCYAQAGQRSLALRQIGLCADAMRRSLGAGPGPETVALHERIRRGQAPPAEDPAPWPRSGGQPYRASQT